MTNRNLLKTNVLVVNSKPLGFDLLLGMDIIKILGPPKGLIPLMAVIQQNKQTVRPVLDFRELNDHLDPFRACADICTEKLREWQQAGSNVSVLDLRKAYLQVRVHQSL